MKRFKEWHENVMFNFIERFNLGVYQIAWFSWIKGFIMGILIVLMCSCAPAKPQPNPNPEPINEIEARVAEDKLDEKESKGLMELLVSGLVIYSINILFTK